jgi:hypothetical protein
MVALNAARVWRMGGFLSPLISLRVRGVFGKSHAPLESQEEGGPRLEVAPLLAVDQ